MNALTVDRSLIEDVVQALRNEMTGEYGYVDLELRSLVDRLEDELKDAPVWDKTHPQTERCACGHSYDRHFDTYDNMYQVGCKYCRCSAFQKVEHRHVCGLTGFQVGMAGVYDLCPACEVEAGRPPRWSSKNV